MRKKGLVAGVIAAAIIAGSIGAFLALNTGQSVNIDVERIHGTVASAMGSPILGSPDAPITIVEFGDYQCPQCYNWYHNTKPAIVENYINTGKANLVFLDLAFLGRDSPKAAAASYCAEEQGKYWKYHDMLYTFQEGIDDGWASPESLKEFASRLGLDRELFDSCLDSGKFEKRVQHNINEAVKAGATGTPMFIIVGPAGQEQKIGGAQPYSVFKNIFDSMI